MKKQILALGITAFVLGIFGSAVQNAQAAVVITQDDQYVYYKWQWGDMEDWRQQQLRADFIKDIQKKIPSLHLPQDLADASMDQIAQSINGLSGDITLYQNQAQKLREQRGIKLQDLTPTGMFFALGINGSMSVPGVPVAGAGASVMFTAAAAPIRVQTFDRFTGKLLGDSTELNDDFGGLIQVGAGLTQSEGASGRFAAGFIFGDMPQMSTFIGGGFSEGISADADLPFIGGIGITALVTSKNPQTGLRNIVVFGMKDMLGPKAGAETHVVAYYLADQSEVATWFGVKAPTAQTPVPIATPSPSPSPSPSATSSGTPVVQPPVPPSGNPVVHPPVVLATDPLSNPGTIQPLTK